MKIYIRILSPCDPAVAKNCVSHLHATIGIFYPSPTCVSFEKFKPITTHMCCETFTDLLAL